MNASAHPDFGVLATSWQLALRADGYSANTVASYRLALQSLTAWLAATHPDVGPAELDRDHVRGWLVYLRETASSSTARAWFSGTRHFCRFLLAEGEADHDATEGVKTPKPGEQTTPVLSVADIRRLLDTCSGTDFTARRDAAIIMVMVDGGLRLAEVTGLKTTSVDLQEGMLFVEGKGSRRSGPRRRAVPLGVKASRSVDRYLRVRRRHPYAATAPLWLGSRDRATLSAWGVKAMLKRRAELAGLEGVHAHVLRHSWASAFRSAGGSEGDLLVLGGWRSRAMLDRYGKAAAADRAADAYRRLSLGDRL